MCGCGKKSSPSRIPALRPSIGPRPVIRGVAAAPSPGQLRALSLPGNISPRTVVKMDAERRKIEKIRREAIRQALNK